VGQLSSHGVAQRDLELASLALDQCGESHHVVLHLLRQRRHLIAGLGKAEGQVGPELIAHGVE